jgi:uncharacterized protein
MGRTGDKVSILGYGCMRFPKAGARIDEERTERQIVSAVERGVNYFDTAFIYPGSEATLGRILAKDGRRDKVLVATKLFPLRVNSQKDMESLLDTQLKRLQTDHIDYYLMHSLTSLGGWERLKSLGALDFIEQAKRDGRVRHVGFSYHGGRHAFRLLVDDYEWDMCQVQYNYVDETNQAGREGLEYAASKGLGVVVMEPLRGGTLAGRVPPPIQAVWDSAHAKRTPAEWALRWVWDNPAVSTVLSGMNNEAHIDENLRVADSAYANALSPEERELVGRVRETLSGLLKVGCTGCNYCMPCPAGVNIPQCFEMYNNLHVFGGGAHKFSYMGYTVGADGGKPSYASLCTKCGKCERICPQSLPIREHLASVARDMQGWYFLPVAKGIQGYHRLRRRFYRKGPASAKP